MKAQNLFTLAAATLLTAATLASLNDNVANIPAQQINGAKVINLSPLEVRPSAEDLRAAALLTEAGMVSATATAALTHGAETGARLLSAQLVMPYYSFGTKLGRISKE
ncbi:hypothetical protein [Dyella tabacisoli]|uniref:DUF4148 domain-containing protein n=1 Tax=Dyella tabacisoli TaxID=2282381 RepID=A0A369UNL3_9GAMM|nr:hypothetical protein [Dyella tabacisoli]RDD81210.1 hypothetical protein DVJ77_12870 [Dyella tabacisoli]